MDGPSHRHNSTNYGVKALPSDNLALMCNGTYLSTLVCVCGSGTAEEALSCLVPGSRRRGEAQRVDDLRQQSQRWFQPSSH